MSQYLLQFDKSIEERFEKWVAENKHIYAFIRDKALQLKRRGVKHYGMKALFEVVRYDTALRSGNDDFKINNNYTALMARLLMQQESELEGFFETRKRRTVEC